MLEDWKPKDVDELSDEEVLFWATKVQEHEQAKQMRIQLKNYIDLQNTERESKTIKLGGD